MKRVARAISEWHMLVRGTLHQCHPICASNFAVFSRFAIQIIEQFSVNITECTMGFFNTFVHSIWLLAPYSFTLCPFLALCDVQISPLETFVFVCMSLNLVVFETEKLHRTDDEEERKRGHLLPLEWAWWLVSGAELEVGDCCRDF